MKLIEALEILRRPVNCSARTVRVSLACGFTPLHLKTFLEAQLRELFPQSNVSVISGRYGDLVGNIERQDLSELDAMALPIEWSDLDSRLGVRTLGGWRPDDLIDIVENVKESAERIQKVISEAARHVRVVISMPTLPLPPIFTTSSIQAGSIETRLHSIVGLTAESLSQIQGVCLASQQYLGLISPLNDRYDLKADLAVGFPYTLRHASSVATSFSKLIRNRPTKKGLITDLDDVLWGGIVGDDGIDGISWELDRHTQMHGLYQQVLSALAGTGVLIGVASKNDAQTVKQAFERTDLLLSKNDLFPIEVNWSRKSDSVQRILKTWNIGADSVIFIDDSPMELAEVKAAFPELECRLFPKNDDQGIWDLLVDLRAAYEKTIVTHEDRLRLNSIRGAGDWQRESTLAGGPSDDFLQSADASITFEFNGGCDNTRAFALVNKTNQFNLNGKRFADHEWRRLFDNQTSFLLTASYKDKFGPLGTIAVLFGSMHGNIVHLSGWVMSCRAFSRRIEYQCLKFLFDNLNAEEILFEFEPTQKNTVLHEFLSDVLKMPPVQGCSLAKHDFLARIPSLFHHIEVSVHA